ncbi:MULTISPECIES: DUF6434 domain-containing protein [unclassified Pseudomonas]
MAFDWHSGPITRSTLIDKNYRNTQKVRCVGPMARHTPLSPPSDRSTQSAPA